MERTELTVVSRLVRYTMCIPLTPVLCFLYTVIIEVYTQCFTESVRHRDLGKSTARAEISSPRSLHFMAVKGAHIGSALRSLFHVFFLLWHLRRSITNRGGQNN